VPRGARNWLRSPSKSIEWLWDSLCFSVGVTKKLALLPGRPLVCHPRVYKTFLRCQLNDPEQRAEFNNFVGYCDRSMCLFDVGAAVVRGAKRTLTRFAPLLFLELHNEMIRSEGGDPSCVLDDLAEMGYEVFSVGSVRIERSAILQMPICRLVGKCRQSV